MPPLPVPSSTPRVVIYHQTQYLSDGTYISLLPLITEFTNVTHVMIAAFHLNDNPGDITLNDDPPSNEKYDVLWEETSTLQFSETIKVLAMLGGAAKGTFTRLDGDVSSFEAFYCPLRDVLRKYTFDGIDLDVEEHMSLTGVLRLIDRLRADFGPKFLITLAPVATALHFGPNLSGFDYQALEVMRGKEIAWYNAQFYCGWGELSNTAQVETIYACGWDTGKIVLGTVTSPGNGSGWVGYDGLRSTVRTLMARHARGKIGGIMGWEYFNALDQDGKEGEPWTWVKAVADILGLADGQKG
ncbi:hypothetical protein MMC25_001214 [Agyrium rufum]|nr:hypothetical protein [Agyrium rufum]